MLQKAITVQGREEKKKEKLHALEESINYTLFTLIIFYQIHFHILFLSTLLNGNPIPHTLIKILKHIASCPSDLHPQSSKS